MKLHLHTVKNLQGRFFGLLWTDRCWRCATDPALWHVNADVPVWCRQALAIPSSKAIREMLGQY